MGFTRHNIKITGPFFLVPVSDPKPVSTFPKFSGSDCSEHMGIPVYIFDVMLLLIVDTPCIYMVLYVHYNNMQLHCIHNVPKIVVPTVTTLRVPFFQINTFTCVIPEDFSGKTVENAVHILYLYNIGISYYIQKYNIL